MTSGVRRLAAVGRLAARGTSVGAALAAAALGVASSIGPSSASPPVGEAVVVTAKTGSSTEATPLAEGTGTTAFSLALPVGAACSGDSTDGGYRVQSFLVPASVDVTTLTFGALGPLPRGVGSELRQPLYALDSRPFANAATNLANEPGGPGTIINIPNVDLSELGGEDLPPGEYVVGIACTRGPAGPDQLDRLWTARFEVVASTDPVSPPSWKAPDSADPAPAPTTTAAVSVEPAGPGTVATSTTADSPEGAGGSGAETDVRQGSAGDGGGDVAPPGRGAGGPPSFRYPAAEVVSALSITGGSTTSLAVWIVAAVLAARAAHLLSRRTFSPVPSPR